MCGAYFQFNEAKFLAERFNAELPDKEIIKRYNIRPSQLVPVIFNTDVGKIDYALWGIHPHYDKTGKMFFINARNDSMEKPTWKKMLQEQRCMVLADGFYEWKKNEDSKYKTPYLFQLKDKSPFGFAGLWQLEKDANGIDVPHCVIITTEPNKLVEDVHNRMPAILTSETEKIWMNSDIDFDTAIDLLIPYSAKDMHAYPISTLVNKPINDTIEILNFAENSK